MENTGSGKKDGKCYRVKTAYHGKQRSIARSISKQLTGSQVEDRAAHGAAKADQSRD
jgi:hypothetical protein